MNPAFHRIIPSPLPLSDESFKVKFNEINTQKSHRADNMSSKEMKIVADEFSPKVLWKSGNKEDCSNYRPSTLLSTPSKEKESVTCDNTDNHLSNVLQKNQWGYRKGVSL